MMDSHDTNQPLKQGELEEEKKAVEVSEEITETPAEETIGGKTDRKCFETKLQRRGAAPVKRSCPRC